MLKVVEGTTFYSAVTMPNIKSLAQLELKCPATTDKKDSVIILKITPSLIYNDIFENKSHEVFKSKTSYELTFDEKITIEELYRIFYKTMVMFISGFSAIEKSTGSQPYKGLHPIPFENLRDYLQPIVDWMNS